MQLRTWGCSRVKKRSRAYPAIDLESAIELLNRVVPILLEGDRERDDLAQTLGYSSGKGGAAARKIAALGHYGFLNRKGSIYSLSALSGYYIKADSQEDRQYAVGIAFRQPTLFQDLVEKLEPEGRIPADLGQILEHQHGIAHRASKDVARIFRVSAQFVGVIDLAGNFLSSQGGDDKSPLSVAGELPPNVTHFDADLRRTNRPPKTVEHEFQLPLTDGAFCTLKVLLPASALSEKDFELIQMQLPYQGPHLQKLHTDRIGRQISEKHKKPGLIDESSFRISS